ncbi:hypothetical protein CP09DC79_1122B, partial [Chlamydia psittaci 09DC79]
MINEFYSIISDMNLKP